MIGVCGRLSYFEEDRTCFAGMDAIEGSEGRPSIRAPSQVCVESECHDYDMSVWTDNQDRKQSVVVWFPNVGCGHCPSYLRCKAASAHLSYVSDHL